jgi:hypothetical protein
VQGILYEEPSFFLFALITCLLGGWAAWMTGRAMAANWKPYWQTLVYCLLLAGAVRFIHYALFKGTLLSLHFYLVDLAVLVAIASAGFRMMRTRQMTRQYSWLYERTGPFTWRERMRA